MDKIKNLTIILIGIIALIGLAGAIVPITTQGQGGAGSKDVNVINTPTVQAQQSGAWNIGIAGTPTVQIGNTDTAPVKVRIVDDYERQPFQEVRIGEFENDNDREAQAVFNPIPSDKQLVIEHVSASVSVPPGQTVRCFIAIPVAADTGYIPHYLALIPQGTGDNNVNRFVTSQPIRLHAYANTRPFVSCSRSGFGGVNLGVGFTTAIAGHHVDVP